MTQKELLYFEDAIGHEKSIIQIIDKSIKNLDDDNLISFLENERQSHVEMKDKLMNLLGGKANE